MIYYDKKILYQLRKEFDGENYESSMGLSKNGAIQILIIVRHLCDCCESQEKDYRFTLAGSMSIPAAVKQLRWSNQLKI